MANRAAPAAAVAGQRQRFRLLCATCNYSICDAGQRREGEILKSHYSLETLETVVGPRLVHLSRSVAPMLNR